MLAALPEVTVKARWRPAVTVAAIIERDGKFLLIEELDNARLVLNQPAGHWEPGETLPAACVRETLEESGHDFAPTALVGIYRWQPQGTDVAYLRFAFCGQIGERDQARALDPAIAGVAWLSPQEVFRSRERHRSPLVLRCMEDYLAGRRMPLDYLTYFE